MFESRTREHLKAEMLAELSEASGLTAMEGGFADQCLGPMAVQLERVYMSMDALLGILHVDESCGGLIDVAADNFGLTRKAGAVATAEVTFSGEAGVTIPAGSIFATSDGLQYDLAEDVVLDAQGAGGGILTAQEAGGRYNVAAGVIDRMLVNPPGVTSFRVGAAANGVDVESDKALVGRYYDRLQRPVTSGNANHYRQWALEVPGVGEARVTSLVHGPGTVGITLVDETFGPVEPGVVETVINHIEEERPVGIQVPPYVVSATALTVSVTATVRPGPAADIDAVQAAFRAALEGYLVALVREQYAQTHDAAEEDRGYRLSYNRVAATLMTTAGVVDYATLTINGGTEDVAIGRDEVPVVGEVAVTWIS